MATTNYINEAYAVNKQSEPCGQISPDELKEAINTASIQIDDFLLSNGVNVVPLLMADITDSFKVAVVKWVVSVIYFSNNNSAQGSEWRKIAEKEIKNFIAGHQFTGTTTNVPIAEPQTYQYSDDITDWKEPRDV